MMGIAAVVVASAAFLYPYVGKELVPDDDQGEFSVNIRLPRGTSFPRIFGRGGEEALVLAEAGVPFEVVPGVSALAAVPAAAGIPLTHRGLSAQVRVISGRSADGEVELAAADGAETLVLFMALNELGSLCERLLALGLDPETPAAVISRGTCPDQEVVVAEVSRIAAAAEGLPGPALSLSARSSAGQRLRSGRDESQLYFSQPVG